MATTIDKLTPELKKYCEACLAIKKNCDKKCEKFYPILNADDEIFGIYYEEIGDLERSGQIPAPKFGQIAPPSPAPAPLLTTVLPPAPYIPVETYSQEGPEELTRDVPEPDVEIQHEDSSFNPPSPRLVRRSLPDDYESADWNEWHSNSVASRRQESMSKKPIVFHLSRGPNPREDDEDPELDLSEYEEYVAENAGYEQDL